MPALPPVDPKQFDQPLRAANAQIAQLQQERSDYLARLALTPSDAEVDKMAAAVEAEIGAVEGKRNRLLAAQQEAAARSTAATRDVYVKQLRADALEIDRLGAEAFEVGQALYRHVVASRPMIQRLAEIGKQRGSLSWGILRAGTDHRSQRDGMVARASASGGVLAMLTEAAFRAAGIGALAPTAGITVPPAPIFPGRDGWSGEAGRRSRIGPDRTQEWGRAGSDVNQLARDELDKSEQALQAALARAIEAVEKGPR